MFLGQFFVCTTVNLLLCLLFGTFFTFFSQKNIKKISIFHAKLKADIESRPHIHYFLIFVALLAYQTKVCHTQEIHSSVCMAQQGSYRLQSSERHCYCNSSIEEGFIQKARQTVVVTFLGKWPQKQKQWAAVFPYKATTAVCLGFCLHPYSMNSSYSTLHNQTSV